MQKVAMFEKVSLLQFKKDVENIFGTKYNNDQMEEMYRRILLPTRSTSGSAGYDFKLPFDISLNKGEWSLIPTGIRCRMFNEWVLMLYPRSGLGFKYGFELKNTVGVIDSDYYDSDNEGHIMAKISQNEEDILYLQSGQGFMQGIFTEYGITRNDNAIAKRNGGFGSTGR